jgi:transposase
MLHGQIDLLDQAVLEVAEKNEKARLLMMQPGVGRWHSCYKQQE